MKVAFGPLALWPLLVICNNLRPLDAEECLNSVADTPESLAATHFAAAGPLSRIIWYDGQPVAVVGTVYIRPGHHSAFAFGTAEWPKVALSITKYVKRRLIPALIDSGARRVEARSHLNHRPAHAWLQSLGAHEEGRLREFGRDGSDYLLFAWTRSDVLPR